jgi:hypothetical protein
MSDRDEIMEAPEAEEMPEADLSSADESEEESPRTRSIPGSPLEGDPSEVQT